MSQTASPSPPHGGTWIRTAAGAVEISVFETAVPPHFRLYFFDGDGRPAPLPAGTVATIETRRPDSSREVFRFIEEDGYLRSTSDIPEPHEFDVKLTLTCGEGAEVY